MRPSRRPIIIATRRSRLALAQSQAIADTLQRLHPAVRVELLHLDSEADRHRQHPLATSGRKGQFTRAIEKALFDKRADLAVHSLKDLPVQPTRGLILAAIPRRADVRDAFIGPNGADLSDLAPGATVGTGSLRRAAQLRRLRNDLKVEPIRGNIDTRLAKLEAGECNALVLAMAGLQRADLLQDLHAPMDTHAMLPAAGQGALAIQSRADDHVSLRRCLPLNDATTATMVHAERDLVGRLEADCHSCIAALAEPEQSGEMRLRARVLSEDGRKCLETDLSGPVKQARRLVNQAEQQLRAAGAMELLHQRS